MLANVGRQHLDDLGMIVLGVLGDALKGVDAAQDDVDLGLAGLVGSPELVDRSGEALGDLACPVESCFERRTEQAR